MMNGGGDAVQVMYMEVEGIKFAYQVSKDAARLAKQLMTFLIRSMMDAPYKKISGKTNIKNLKARSNGQAMTAVTVDKKIYRKFEKDAKKYGILYHAFYPLKSGKKNSVELLVAEKDLSMLQELLSKYKNQQIKEDVRCGMSKEQSEQDYDENNRTETMQEFTDHVGAATPEKVFDADMKETFGEDYQGKVIDYVKASKYIAPKAHAAGGDKKKIGTLAEVIQFRDRAERLKNEAQVKIPFVYDPEHKKSQIIDETESHIKIAGKGLGLSDKNRWGGVWVPKESVIPPLEQKNSDGLYTANLKNEDEIIVEDLSENERPQKIRAEDLGYSEDISQKSFVAEEQSYKAVSLEKQPDSFDITIGKTYMEDAKEDMAERKTVPMIWGENNRAVKTRIPGTYGENMKFLWLGKENIRDAYDGKSILTSLDKDKDYKLYDVDNNILGSMKGEELYKKHYDPVKRQTGKNRMQRSGKERRI